MSNNVLWFSDLGLADLEQVGGKNSSLGEMVSNLASLGVRVPDGFATTADAYRRFIGDTGLAETISSRLAGLDTDDVQRARPSRKTDPRRPSSTSRSRPDLEADIRTAYDQLAGPGGDASFAVRSSATAEDLPDASFAGQQETFLNVRGIDAILTAIREVFASLYNDRAIAYRVHHRFEHETVALSAGVQQMVRSDIGASGVMFTMDTESGFTDAVFITSSYGLGEAVVQGAVNPDEFYVYKPALRAGRPAILKRGIGGKAIKMIYTSDAGRSARPPSSSTCDESERGLLSLTDDEVTELARQALVIEEHYGRPMDIEWGKDGARRSALHPAGPPGDGAVPRAAPDGAAVPAERAGHGADRGPGDRSEDRRRPGPGAAARWRSMYELRARRGAGRRHDRSRLGADHETGLGDRHQPGRADLSRRDHRPRARHPGGRRHRQRDPRAGRRSGGDGLLRRG